MFIQGFKHGLEVFSVHSMIQTWSKVFSRSLFYIKIVNSEFKQLTDLNLSGFFRENL